jgi:hypothetical protein
MVGKGGKAKLFQLVFLDLILLWLKMDVGKMEKECLLNTGYPDWVNCPIFNA